MRKREHLIEEHETVRRWHMCALFVASLLGCHGGSSLTAPVDGGEGGDSAKSADSGPAVDAGTEIDAGTNVQNGVCIEPVLREVADQWISAHQTDLGDNRWQRATLMIGLWAAAQAVDDDGYRAYVGRWAASQHYAINGGPTTTNADNHNAGQTYIALYVRYGDPDMLGPIQAAIDARIASGQRDDWWWIDAQFMASPVYAQLARITRNAVYGSAMFELFVDARDARHLWDADEGLWYRDETYLWPAHQTPNGKKIFWSRGNGWVLAAIARTLEELPDSSSYRTEYENKLRAMATALAHVQRSDGLWNVSLADAADYPGPESSGTSFFTYAIAFGINRGILDRATFLPVVDRAWRGLVGNALQPGHQVGYVQGVGEEPSSSQPVTAQSTQDFGTGAFLLAASEVIKLGPDVGCRP